MELRPVTGAEMERRAPGRLLVLTLHARDRVEDPGEFPPERGRQRRRGTHPTRQVWRRLAAAARWSRNRHSLWTVRSHGSARPFRILYSPPGSMPISFARPA